MNIIEYVSGTRMYKATLVPRKYIIVEFFNNDQFVSIRKFEIGDEAECDSYDSFNIRYITNIISIGKRTVAFNVYNSTKRLKAEEFARRNCDFNATAIAHKNTKISQHI